MTTGRTSDLSGGGFSSAPARRLVRPVVEGQFGTLAVNVADQRGNADSLLNWMERVIRRRRESPEIGWGGFALLDTGDHAVLAHRCDWEGSSFVAVHNLDASPRHAVIDLGDVEGVEEVVDLLDSRHAAQPLNAERRLDLRLEGYDHRWLRLRRHGSRNPP